MIDSYVNLHPKLHVILSSNRTTRMAPPNEDVLFSTIIPNRCKCFVRIYLDNYLHRSLKEKQQQQRNKQQHSNFTMNYSRLTFIRQHHYILYINYFFLCHYVHNILIESTLKNNNICVITLSFSHSSLI